MKGRFSKNFILGLAFSIAPFFANSQSLELRDAQTDFPISHALVFNKTKTTSVLSDERGRVALSNFSNSTTIYIQHPSYSTIEIELVAIVSDSVIHLAAQEIELSEVVISASQKLESSKEVPRKVVSISKRDISFYKPQTSADMLENSDQVFVQKSQQGGGSPMIRGFSANRILLVYDNIRMNNAISRSGNLHNIISVDPNFLERTEIIYGPGTVVYGSDALGGVVHMRSEEISLGADKMELRGDLALNYASANQGKTAHLDVGSANVKWGWHTSLTYSQFDDLQMGNKGPDEYLRNTYVKTVNGKDVEVKNENPTVQVPSGFDQFSLAQKFKFAASNYSDIQVFGQLSGTSDIPRYDRLIQKDSNQLKYAQWYYGPQIWALTGIRWNSRKSRTWTDLSTISVHYQYWEESRHDRKFGDSSLNERFENLNIYGIDAGFSKSLALRQSLNYGFSSYYNTVNSTAHASNVYNEEESVIPTRYPDGGSEMSISGVYVNYKNAVRTKWNLNIGLRYTYQTLNSKFEDQNLGQSVSDEIKINTGSLSGSAGATYRLIPRMLLRANLTSGFRAPNVDDVSKLFDPEPETVVVPNPGLKSEYLYSGEVGIEGSDSAKWWMDVNAFYSYLDGAIIRDDFSVNGLDSIYYDSELKQVQALVNKDYAIIYGLGFGIRYSPVKHIQIKVNYTITRGWDSDDQPLRHVSPDFGAIHAIYAKGKFKGDLFVKYHAGLMANQLALSEVSKGHLYAIDDNGNPYSPSWSTVNIMFQYKVTKNLDLEFGIENITDLRYRTYSSGITAAGRNFVFGIKSKL